MTNKILAFKALKHNNVEHIVNTVRNHKFPVAKPIRKAPVYLGTKNLVVGQDYTVKTMEDLKP